MIRKKILALVLLLVLTLSISAVYVFKVLDTTSGLTSSQINCITKDSRGYMWFGTPAGLFRYDGYVFKKFQSDSNDGNSLSDSYIRRIYEGLNGQLWIKTSQGVCVYHPQTETFDRDERSIFERLGVPGIASVIHITPNKELWMFVPGKGVYAYNMAQQLLYTFLFDEYEQLPKGEIVDISDSREGAVMIYSNGYIANCSIRNGKQRVVYVNDGLKTSHNSRNRIYCDSNNDLWVFGQSTLMQYHFREKVWDNTVAAKLGLSSNNTDLHVFDIKEDREGNIWIGTDQLGLRRLNMNTGEIELVQPINMRMRDPVGGPIRVMSIFVDQTDLIWVGTQRRGVSYWGKNIYKFTEDRVGDMTVMCEDNNGRIWYGTADHGIIDYDGPLASLYVTSMVIADDGSFWVGSKSMGITHIIPGQGVKMYNSNTDQGKTIIDNNIHELCKDRRGNIWIATEKGLQVYSKLTQQFATYTKENGKFQSNNITALFNTLDNKMLVGTAEGLVIMNPNDGSTEYLIGNRSNVKRFTNSYITQVYEDSRHLIWVGTRDGLNVLTPSNDDLIYITEDNGLCCNNICGITEDKNGNIWITTSNGASRIVVERNKQDASFGYTLYNYDTTDGLQSNEFGDGACITTRDGRVLIGGKYGSAWVVENKEGGSQKLDKVILSQLFVGDEEIQIGQRYDHNTILPQALNELTSISLNNSQNTFTIKFAVGNYNQSEKQQFIYWMQGNDDVWHNGDPLKHGVTFTNLSSGSYTLHVKAVSADGAVSAEETTIDIHIAAPLWFSWRMIVVYLIVIFIIWCIWRYGIRKLIEVYNRQHSIMQELEYQREEIKQSGNDLRQPMVRMTNIITQISGHEQSLKMRELVNSLHYELLQLITRVSEMQITLDDPMQKAEKAVDSALTFDENGSVMLPGLNEHFSYSSRLGLKELPTAKKRVAFVDDNEEFLNYITERLGDIYQLTTFISGRELLDSMSNGAIFDIVLCEHSQSEMTGSEICDTIKEYHPEIFCILITDRQLTPQDIRKYHITINADDYLTKPFNINDAMNHINKLLGIDLDMTKLLSNSIKGEKKLLQQENSSMTTAAMDYTLIGDDGEVVMNPANEDVVIPEYVDDEPVHKATEENIQETVQDEAATDDGTDKLLENIIGPSYHGLEVVDRHLLRDIDQYVVQNMIRGQLDMTVMSRTFNISRIDLFRKIQSITSHTPAEFVREIRLQHACDLLVRTDINISDVAINTGFVTTDNFNSIFKEKIGMSPIEYRMANANSFKA